MSMRRRIKLLTSIKSCPKCGQKPMHKVIEENYGDRLSMAVYGMACLNCGIASPMRMTVKRSIKAWNKLVAGMRGALMEKKHNQINPQPTIPPWQDHTKVTRFYQRSGTAPTVDHDPNEPNTPVEPDKEYRQA